MTILCQRYGELQSILIHYFAIRIESQNLERKILKVKCRGQKHQKSRILIGDEKNRKDIKIAGNRIA